MFHPLSTRESTTLYRGLHGSWGTDPLLRSLFQKELNESYSIPPTSMTLLHNKSLLGYAALCFSFVSSSVHAQTCPQILLSSTVEADDFPSQIRQGTSIDYDGIVLVQQFGGNLQILTGEVGNLNCLVWESGLCEIPDDSVVYSSRLRPGDGRLVTAKDSVDTTLFDREIVFRTTSDNPTPNPVPNYYFSVDCDGTVGVYDSNLPGARAVWTDDRNDCGITSSPTVCTRTVLMRQNDAVQSDITPIQGDGAFIDQEINGNVVVTRGTPADPGDILWQSCSDINPDQEYKTILQGDSQFITRPLADLRANVWKRDDFTAATAAGEWELALECVDGDYGKLVISDSGNGAVAWDENLRPTCDAQEVGVCPTATLLLGMDQSIWNGAFIDTTNGYVLQQGDDGTLELWKGTIGDLDCQVLRTNPPPRPAGDAYTKMQNDGNLVTYWRTALNPFRAIWSSGTQSSMGSFSLVIDDCIPVDGANPNRKSVAIYEKNPITDADAVKLTEFEFDDSCANRIRGLRGGPDTSP
jgi:hypothetical protein